MCVVALAIGVHPQYPIILLGNRDEFHTRPAAPLHAWTDGSGIIAGQDLQAGGTWLGAHPASGRMVVVTNVRGDLPDPSKASRGALVSGLLSGSGPYAAPNPDQLDDFNAFNLIFVEDGAANILTNRPAPAIQRIESGAFAVANQPAFAPCARAERLRTLLTDHLSQGGHPHDLLELLLLRDDPALFILGDPYGTRCSTLVLQDQHGQLEIIERRYEAGGHPIGMTALTSQIG